MTGRNPLRDLRTFLSLLRLYRQEAPDIVHHATIKPVIYGTLASHFVRVPAVGNANSGIGSLITQRGFSVRSTRGLVNLLYRIASSHGNMRSTFQNREALRSFVANPVIAEQLTPLTRGLGVNLREFSFTAEPLGPATFVLVGRMLSDKGVREFVAATRSVRQLQPQWRFQLVGGVDPRNPSSSTEAELESWGAEGIVEWLGSRADVAQIPSGSHVVCLPSYHEHLPKSLLEASAIGRSMIVTNLPGCPEVVRDGITGLRVEPRDSKAPAEAKLSLGQDPALRAQMRHAAGDRAAALYSVEDVVQDTFLIYDELLRG